MLKTQQVYVKIRYKFFFFNYKNYIIVNRGLKNLINS